MGEINPGAETSTMFIGQLSPSSSDQVDSSLDTSVRAEVGLVSVRAVRAVLVSVRAEVAVDIPDTESLLHQMDIETGSFDTEPPVGQETSLLGVANGDSGVSSQSTQQPYPSAVAAVAENEPPNPDLETELKVATLVILISSGALVSALFGLVGNEKSSFYHQNLVKAFSILIYISLVLGIGLFVLTLRRPNVLCLVKITKIIMWISIASTTYALSCATSLLLSKLFEVLVVFVVPSLMFCLIAAISWNN